MAKVPVLPDYYYLDHVVAMLEFAQRSLIQLYQACPVPVEGCPMPPDADGQSSRRHLQQVLVTHRRVDVEGAASDPAARSCSRA